MNSRLLACLFAVLAISGCISKSFVISADAVKGRSATNEYQCVVRVSYTLENPNNKIAKDVRLDIAAYDMASLERRDFTSFYLYDVNPQEVKTGTRDLNIKCSDEKMKLILIAESSDDPFNIKGRFEKEFQLPRNV